MEDVVHGHRHGQARKVLRSLLTRMFNRRPVLPPRPLTHAAQPNFSEGPRMGRLIDIDDDDEPKHYSRSLTDPLDESDRHNSVSSFKSLPPNRPSKPEALRGISGESKTLATRRGPPRPPKPRKLSLSQDPDQHPTSSPLSQTQNAKSPASAASSTSATATSPP